jgi:hypothetical protein
MGTGQATEDKTAKATIGKIKKLLETLAELRTKESDVLAEMETLLGGGVGIAAQLKAVQHAFETAHATRYSGRYVWQHTRDVPNLKRLIKSLGVEELRVRFGNYLRNNDRFFTTARHSFGAFVASVNQHAAAGNALPEGFELDAPAVADCKHHPPCTTDQQHTRRKMAEVRGDSSAF